MAAGAAAFGLIGALVLHFRVDPAAALAAQQRRVDLVAAMQLDLTAATAAERSAVLAVTDEESVTFAGQARAKTADVERERAELQELVESHGTSAESDFLAQYSEAFTEFRRIDDELLGLAVKNTNIKATALLFGPGAAAVDEMDAALARMVPSTADAPDATKASRLAYGIRVSALRIETLLPPHIAEESAEKM